MVLTAADQRLTDTVEKDLANAALILASGIAEAEMNSSSVARGALHRRRDDRIEIRFAGESEDGTKRTWRSGHEMFANRSNADIAEGRLDVGF
jgi:hypothetical protein